MEYASPSWSPWISDTNMKLAQRVQNDALRSVVGSAALCPVDFLHLEANIEPIRDRFLKNDLVLAERYKRLPVEPWRKTELLFDMVPLTKPKDEYSKPELKTMTEEKLAKMEAEVMI